MRIAGFHDAEAPILQPPERTVESVPATAPVESPEPEMPAIGPKPSVPSSDPARRVFRVFAILAPIAVTLAILVNWFGVPGLRAQPSDSVASEYGSSVPEPDELADSAVELIPDRVIQYETITRQAIPGFGERSAEAVYKTLNMNVEAQVDIVVYARAESFNSAAEAKARLDQLMAPHSANRSQIMVNNLTPATVGESPDGSAYVVGWVRGNSATFVKASFAEWTPPNQVKLIKRQGDQIVDAVDVYQRTGREGVSK